MRDVRDEVKNAERERERENKMWPRLILALLLVLAVSAGSQRASAQVVAATCKCECDSTWIDNSEPPTLMYAPDGAAGTGPEVVSCMQATIKYKICNKAVTGFNFEFSNCDRKEGCFDIPVRFGYCTDRLEDMPLVPNPCGAFIPFYQLTPI